MMRVQEALTLSNINFMPYFIQDIDFSATTTFPKVKKNITYLEHSNNFKNELRPLEGKELKVFQRLNDVWGNDEDGAYDNLYQYHNNNVL
jgi:hypothetical protein